MRGSLGLVLFNWQKKFRFEAEQDHFRQLRKYRDALRMNEKISNKMLVDGIVEFVIRNAIYLSRNNFNVQKFLRYQRYDFSQINLQNTYFVNFNKLDCYYGRLVVPPSLKWICFLDLLNHQWPFEELRGYNYFSIVRGDGMDFSKSEFMELERNIINVFLEAFYLRQINFWFSNEGDGLTVCVRRLVR